MIYSIHTMEIKLNVDTEKFGKLLEKAFYNAKGKNRVFPDKDRNDIYHDTALTDEGIKIRYHDDKYKKNIRLIVNPTEVLGGDDVIKLWKPNEDNISKFLHKLEKHIKNYFNSKYELNDFELSRIDFTVNIDVGSRERVADYIRVLHNVGKVKCFDAKYEKNDKRINKEHSFDLVGNSNGVEFTAYNKEAASGRKDAKGLLRVEVRLTKPRAIRGLTEETATSNRIADYSLRSREIFLAVFSQVVPVGDYYKKAKAEKIVMANVKRKNLKLKMLRLITLIPEKKSLLNAQKELNARNLDEIMCEFAMLNLSPVTISKRHKIKRLEGLISYLE